MPMGRTTLIGWRSIGRRRMSEIKIERKPLPQIRATRQSIREFCDALRQLKVGESFAYKMTSYHRLGMSWAQSLLERRFMIKDGRVWRIA